MSYIGNTNTTQGFIPAVDYFNGNGSTTAFTLSRPVASVAQVQAVIENVPQNPGSAFTVSGSTITFTSAPPSGTSNIYVYYTSPITQVIQPGQGTVGTAQLANGLAFSQWTTTGSDIYYNTGNVGIGTSSPTGSAAKVLNLAGALHTEIRLHNTGTGTTNSDGLGIQMWNNNIAYLWNYENAAMSFGTNALERMVIDSSGRVTMPYQPAFSVFKSTSASSGAWANVPSWNNEFFNTGSFVLSTGVFTAPVSGRYLFAFSARGNDGSGSSAGVAGKIIKNGTNYFYDVWGSVGVTYDGSYRNYVSGAVVMNMSAGDTAAFQYQGFLLQGNFSGHLLS